MAEMTGSDNSALLAELINANGRCNNDGAMWNNPFIYLVWMMMLGRGGFGNNGGAVEANDINGKLNSLQGQISTNQNTNLMMDAIGGNKDALNGIANALGLNTSTLQSAIQNCCCNTQQSILKMGYEGQLRDQTNTCAIASRIDQLANGVQQGFAALGYNQTQQTQRILDQMCHNETQSLRDKLAEASQNAQTAYLISQLKTTA